LRGRVVLSLLLLLSACGYRVVAPNSELAGGVRSVCVPVFVNRTAEPAAELFFTEATKDQLARAGRLGGDASEAQLVGTIVAVNSGPVMAAPALPKQPVFRISAVITLSLIKGGATLSSATVSTSEEFPSGADVLLTESNRGAALKRLAETMVREGLERLQSPAP
jgi:hypothetical protein